MLDDSHSPELKQTAGEFGFAYATRPNQGWFKKSENLWFGFQVSYRLSRTGPPRAQIGRAHV